jgi:IPT/TIG domain
MAKAVGRIDTISASTGYTTGGQLLKVKGLGFTSRNISVTIDGVACSIQSNKLDQFTCLTGPQPSPSNESFYVG